MLGQEAIHFKNCFNWFVGVSYFTWHMFSGKCSSSVLRGYKKIGTKQVDERGLKELNLNKGRYCLIYLKEAQFKCLLVSRGTGNSVAINKYCTGDQIEFYLN